MLTATLRHPTTTLKVAFATPELQSLVRRTGLAEFAENLPRTLVQQGLEVLVFLPWTIDVEDVRVMGLREVATLRVKDGETSTQVKLHRGHVRDLPVVLIDHPLFRDRHPYGDERGPYGDNWRRYALFTRAILEGTVALGFLPDVIHGFDWTGGLLPLIKQLETGKGHRIRVEVSSSNFPTYARNLNTVRNPYTSTEYDTAINQVMHGPKQPSRITLPVVALPERRPRALKAT